MKDNFVNKDSVGEMFDSIAFRYDFLNHFLSFGIDRIWRRKAIRIISAVTRKPKILDVATGTGDLAIASVKLDPEHITGIDISSEMLQAGREKIMIRDLSGKIDLVMGDSENMKFADNSFDVTMVAFGVRNFRDPLKGLTEMHRVVKPGGMVLVLEFSKPLQSPVRQLYMIYFRYLLPVIGRLVSGNRKAYRYLFDSVMEFPDNEKFLSLMSSAGLTRLSQKKLSGGIASIYTGFKPYLQ